MSDTQTAPTPPMLPGTAIFFYIIAAALVAFGFMIMFVYNPDPVLGGGMGAIVGGDAYNFQIIATRGVGFIAAGIVSAIIALGVQVHQLVQVVAGELAS